MEDEDILTGERLNVIEKPNDNAKGKTVGDDKIVEKDKEEDGLGDEDILTGKKLNGNKFSHKLSKSAKKEKAGIAADQQREMYYLIALFGMVTIIAAIIVFQYIYRVASPRYKDMWKHTDL